MQRVIKLRVLLVVQLKTSMVYVCNARVYFQRDTMDTHRQVVC